MRVEFGALALAFLGGMVAQDALRPEEVVWKDYGPDPMASPEFMQDWMASAQPTEAHRELAEGVGTYAVDMKMWMSPEAEEPMPGEAVATRRTILGGRYTLEEFDSTFMGMPYQGILIEGYDNLSGEYLTIWMDTMSTWPAISRGKKQEDGSVTMSGVIKDVMTPGGRPTRAVITGDERESTMTMFDSLPGGGDFRCMELRYTRREAPAGE